MEEELRQAKKSDLVKINFTCKRKDGSIYDSSEGKEPLQFIIGEGEVFPFLEEAVTGMTKNITKSISVKAEEIFGQYLHEKAQAINRDQFPEGLSPEVGLQFHIEQSDGKTAVLTVTEVTESEVILTPNHPLIGEDLSFNIELLEVEDSSITIANDFFNQGVALQESGMVEEAISSYQNAIKQNPKHAQSFYNLGVIFQQKEFLDQAITYYEIAIGLNKDFIEAHHNLGIAYKDKGLFDEAIICFQGVLRLKPNHAGAYYNLGNTLVAKGQFHEALQSYQKAIEINPEFADAHWSIGLIKLRLGDFEEGWKCYEWRWKLKDVMGEYKFSQPLWDGSDISGKTILLHTEQGFGDTIQFIRYVPLVAQRGATVLIECQKELVPLLRGVNSVKEIFEHDAQLPDFDLHFPLLSLPKVFNTLLSTIPNQVPYIHPNPDLVKQWQHEFSDDTSWVKIGLVWAGDPKPKFGHSRSCHLDNFSSLSQIDNLLFYSLQKGEAAHQVKNPPEGIKLIDYTDQLHDFADTAAFIQNLDIVISVDTAVAHLAGAIGKPVWVLLPFVPDWRWLINREDSPWYPTMRLFRQPSSGDWESVISVIVRELNIFGNNIKK